MKLEALLIYLLITINASAQKIEWTTEYSEDKNTEVVYAIYDSMDVEGEEVTFIEYTAQTKTSAPLENCIEVFNNPDMHKKFYEYTEVSDKIKDVSQKEWIIYYYYSPPWPIADSDCVSRIRMISDTLNNKVVFTSFSESNLIEMKNVTRSEINNITFTFTEKNPNDVEILIEAKLIPATQAPKWMMNAWFPDGPAGTLSRFKELAENL
jgi:hypothetical protein